MSLADRLIKCSENASTRLPKTVLDAIGVYAFRATWKQLKHIHNGLVRFATALSVSSRPIPPQKSAIRAAIELYRRITPRVPPAIEARLQEIEAALPNVDEAELWPQT